MGNRKLFIVDFRLSLYKAYFRLKCMAFERLALKVPIISIIVEKCPCRITYVYITSINVYS